MNKIYFISCYFAPIGRAETNRAFMVKYLSEEGWDVEVVAGENYKSLFLSFQEDSSLKKLLPPGLKVHRFNARPGWLTYDLRKLLNRPNNFRQHWINEAERRLVLQEKGIIYAIIPPNDNAVLAYRLACKYNYPLVLHYVDKILDVDHEIVRRADLVLAITNQIKDSISIHYGRQDVIVAENGILQDIKIPEKTSIGDPLRLVYAGSMTFQTRPEIFARAYNAFMKKNSMLAQKLQIDFYAPASYYSSLFLKPHLSPQVRLKGYLPFGRLMETLPQYDVALASTKGDISFTSKIYQYLNAGLPLLTSSDSRYLPEFVEQRQIGLAADHTIDSVSGKLEELVNARNRILQWRKNVIAIKPQLNFKQRVGEISHLLRKI